MGNVRCSSPTPTTSFTLKYLNLEYTHLLIVTNHPTFSCFFFFFFFVFYVFFFLSLFYHYDYCFFVLLYLLFSFFLYFNIMIIFVCFFCGAFLAHQFYFILFYLSSFCDLYSILPVSLWICLYLSAPSVSSSVLFEFAQPDMIY